ncbi:hypothetical protein PsYK624_020340 [Phanerochaete sordida]|uniref:Uncharacterized protein n=1 Tax=Phanerochaete sordida TaxID=48140 RepID=A0A9P3G1G4_9APHY|nr:hypothetical protein PsYK624_020340 [Phanerochaete sordida]
MTQEALSIPDIALRSPTLVVFIRHSALSLYDPAASPHHDGMAAASDLELIASLALLDIDCVQGCRKGKAQDGAPLTDEELAFQLFAEEANSLLVVSRDAILAESIDNALHTDRTLLRAYATAEAQEARDRTKRGAVV